ncbi:MAG: response regulator transcription factor [Taibaiella sp.]|jgi:DNA-binding NarL/FixJ family response regulator
MKIKVSIVDDHSIVLNGLRKMLSNRNEIELLSVFSDGASVLNSLRRQQPDVLILDLEMPGIKGADLAKIITKQYPQIAILVLTNMNQPYYLNLLLKYGAKGYLLKNTDAQTLSDAITAIHNGQRYIDKCFTGDDIKWSEDDLTDDKKRRIPVITKREAEVLELIAEGLTSNEIAKKLFIALSTVENHRINLFLKFEVKNSVMLVRKGLQLGIIK